MLYDLSTIASATVPSCSDMLISINFINLISVTLEIKIILFQVSVWWAQFWNCNWLWTLCALFQSHYSKTQIGGDAKAQKRKVCQTLKDKLIYGIDYIFNCHIERTNPWVTIMAQGNSGTYARIHLSTYNTARNQGFWYNFKNEYKDIWNGCGIAGGTLVY